MLLKLLIPAFRFATRTVLVQNVIHKPTICFSRSLVSQSIVPPKPNLFLQPQTTPLTEIITRNLIKLSMRKGKRKSVRAVRRRFYRLHWGAWIRAKCGRKKRLWTKTNSRKIRLRQHVICNATQSRLLDKMAGPYWTKRRYYVDDPYEPYHTREEFPLTALKPKPFDPPTGTVPNC